MNISSVTIDINGFSVDDCTAEWKSSGKYLPATQVDPEEHPETEVYKLLMGELDITHLLDECDGLLELIIEDIETNFDGDDHDK